MNPELHIVCFDVPSPPNYGGVIDVYYKIKALHNAGCIIYLHCFQYGRAEAPELKQWCKEVWYYKRKTGLAGMSLRLPYIVYSRRSKKLLERLAAINAPVLFEGIHCSYYMSHPLLQSRTKILRAHNVEHQYYAQLAVRASHRWQRLFFGTESQQLKAYESRLNADVILPLSLTDAAFFRHAKPTFNVHFLAPFHPYQSITSKTGLGTTYCLYHGNLEHPENIEAVLFLLKEVIPGLDLPVIIAGRNPSSEIIAVCSTSRNCKLIPNPDDKTMQQLIADAHIHLMLTSQPTGMKLKLLYALFSGRHVIANQHMLQGTGLEQCCIIANDAESVIKAVKAVQVVHFTQSDIDKRTATLQNHYDNKKNAELILTFLQQKSL